MHRQHGERSDQTARSTGRAQRALAECGVFASVLVATAWLFRTTLLDSIYGNDGKMLAEWTAPPGHGYPQYHNVLYQPAAKLLSLLLPPGLLCPADDPLWVAKSLSVACGALGTALAYGTCRRLGLARWPSLVGALLLAVTPMIWFFAVAIEVHMQHFALVAGGALFTVCLPWRRPLMATLLVAPWFVAFALSHQSAPMLGPGWLWLAQLARRAQGQPLLRLQSWFGVGCVWLAMLLLGHLLVQWQRGQGFAFGFGDVAHTVSVWHRPFTPQVLADAVLLPLGALLPLSLVAALHRGVPGLLRAAAATMMLPLIVAVVWWGIAERGGYLTGPSFVLAALVAAVVGSLRTRIAVPLALGAILLQGACGWWQLRAFTAAGYALDARVARLAAHLGTNRFVLSCNDNAPKLDLWLADAREENLLPRIPPEADAAAWCSAVQPFLAAFVAQGRVVFDVSFEKRDDLPEVVQRCLQPLQQWLRDNFEVTVLDDASWPLWLIEPRR